MRQAFLLLALLALCSEAAIAQRLQARFVTSAYAWERQDTIGTSSSHLYGFQTVQLSLAGSSLAFNSYMQAFNDFDGPFKNDPQLKFCHLNLQWKNIGGVGDLHVGRQAVYAGVGVGAIDGVKTGVKLFDSRIRLNAYGGSLVPAGYKLELIKEASDNMMYGGQIQFLPAENAQIAVSYLNRTIKPSAYKAFRRDSLFNPYLVEIKPGASSEQYLGVDVNLVVDGRTTIYGRYDYDLDFERMARGEVFARFQLMDRFAVTGEYLRREPRLSYNSFFSVFAYNTLTELEAGLEYEPFRGWHTFARFGTVSYGGETTQRITAGIQGSYVGVSMTRNATYGGELSAASLHASYPFCSGMLTPTIMASYAEYKLSEFAKDLDGTLAIGGGIVFRPMQSLSFDGQIQWVNNKIYQDDMRLMLRGSFFISEHLTIF
ncbi:MAG: hypothetical protein FJ215_08520 [Ignavibacteria bacterium]|nr:hypothetical protein [Ignavibacteria bacterium]